MPSLPQINDEDVFAYIVRYKQEHDGASPSYRQIVEACGLRGVSSVVCVLDRLEDAGRIYRGGGLNRSITVVGGSWTMTGGLTNGAPICRCA